ncbi:DUF309 domain-containing protein [Paenibacillus sp. 2TAB23]|uniref:DUF309 domain-containing protein n=1 Tax=Paenibacillus sp. 2TAB23 TaxID=3233004 RepID=UPI003F9E27B3
MHTFPKSYIDYLVEFHGSRDYFECHELLEEYWKEHPEDPLEQTWVGLIQLAVGQYHERRGNLRGAEKMLQQAEKKLSNAPLDNLGIEWVSLQRQLSTKLAQLTQKSVQPYIDIDFHLTNEELKTACAAACAKRGFIWGTPSPMQDESIIHRHTKRDRSDVIAARQHALLAKKRERNGM